MSQRLGDYCNPCSSGCHDGRRIYAARQPAQDYCASCGELARARDEEDDSYWWAYIGRRGVSHESDSGVSRAGVSFGSGGSLRVPLRERRDAGHLSIFHRLGADLSAYGLPGCSAEGRADPDTQSAAHWDVGMQTGPGAQSAHESIRVARGLPVKEKCAGG